MGGCTKEQLEAKGATLPNYIWCTNCELYWHRRVFKQHFNVPGRRTAAKDTPEAIHPARKRFIRFLVKMAVKGWMRAAATLTDIPTGASPVGGETQMPS
jgi:hypothetical protein